MILITNRFSWSEPTSTTSSIKVREASSSRFDEAIATHRVIVASTVIHATLGTGRAVLLGLLSTVFASEAIDFSSLVEGICMAVEGKVLVQPVGNRGIEASFVSRRENHEVIEPKARGRFIARVRGSFDEGVQGLSMVLRSNARSDGLNLSGDGYNQEGSQDQNQVEGANEGAHAGQVEQ